jgi:hypothetical protein
MKLTETKDGTIIEVFVKPTRQNSTLKSKAKKLSFSPPKNRSKEKLTKKL